MGVGRRRLVQRQAQYTAEYDENKTFLNVLICQYIVKVIKIGHLTHCWEYTLKIIKNKKETSVQRFSCSFICNYKKTGNNVNVQQER